MATLRSGSGRASSRRNLIVLGVLVVLAAGAWYHSLRTIRAMRPDYNVLVVLADTVRSDRLGCYGSALGLTPEIDRFAEGAVRFERAFAHAPWTLPSVASLFTSRCPAGHGAGGHIGTFSVLPQDAVTVAEVFRDAGAETHAITNVLFLSSTFGMEQGFATVDLEASDSNLEVRRAGPTTDAALRWLDEHGEKPFFLFVHYFDPHLVYDPPQPFRERFADPQDRSSSGPLFGTRQEMIAFREGRIVLEPSLVRRLEKLYNGEVAYVDSEVGRLLEGVSARGLDENTIVVITSDHGEEFLDHGGFEHGHALYDELLHVPLILRVPSLLEAAAPPARSVPITVRQIDLAPTLCELAGLPEVPAFEGESLVPLLRGEAGKDRPVLSQGNMWGPSGEAWRNAGAKLIRQAAFGGVELYDIQADPGERNDLAAQAVELRERLSAELDLVMESFAAGAMGGEAPALDAEQLERLQSLGYMR